METLIINAHLTYPGWSEGKLNLTFMNLAKAFFLKRGNQVVETFIERGYDPEEEVKKHAAADLVILQTPVNWFSAPWIYKKYVDEVFNVGLTQKVLLARPTTSSRVTTFSRIMGCSISLRAPTSRARLKTTSGIWRNTACDLVSRRT